MARAPRAPGPQRPAVRRRPAPAPARPRLLLLLAAAPLLLLAAPAARGEDQGSSYKEPNAPGDVHTVFFTDCTEASDWQSLTFGYAWRQSNQPGPLTRIMSCTDEQAKRRRPDTLAVINTHTAPSDDKSPRGGRDRFPAYNKPAAIKDWLKHFTPEEEWVLLMEADMMLRRPVTPEDYSLDGAGTAVAAKFDRLGGVANQLALHHIPDVKPRTDTRAGPAGRRADQVGGFMLVHRDDLKRIADLWIKYTEAIRSDPQVGAAGQHVARPRRRAPGSAEGRRRR